MKNKGFSMVELIIVIAIMAILAGALAPALIKYINKSRISTDISNGQQIASAIQTAMSNEQAYDELTTDYSGVDFATIHGLGTNFKKEIQSVIGQSVPKRKAKKDAKGSPQTDMNFYVTVKAASNEVSVFAGSKNDTDLLVYPSVGAKWTD